MLITRRSLYFLLPCSGGATCWRFLSLTQSPGIVLLAQARAYSHATQNKPHMCYACVFAILTA
ncbi:MAG: hypothetical protein J0L56_15025 [Chitinophagales bacterium]|nr:hypothetical protein [Chitinophagales bacterium]